MKKWKMAFWICLTMLLLMTAFSFYYILDQSVTLTYMQAGYKDTEDDLDNISKIINETDLSKTQIKSKLTGHHLFRHMEFEKDTVSLEKVMLIFKDDKLFKITKEW